MPIETLSTVVDPPPDVRIVTDATPGAVSKRNLNDHRLLIVEVRHRKDRRRHIVDQHLYAGKRRRQRPHLGGWNTEP